VKQNLIKDVIQGMLPYLNNAQNEKLQEVLRYTLAKYEVNPVFSICFIVGPIKWSTAAEALDWGCPSVSPL